MKKIVLLLLLVFVLWIIFFLKDDRPNLNGDWTVQQAFVNNEDLAEMDERFSVLEKLGFDSIRAPYLNSLVIGSNTFSLKLHDQEEIEGRIFFPHKDTLVMVCRPGVPYSSRYHISVDTLKSEHEGYLNIYVTLKGIDKPVMIKMTNRVLDRNNWLRETYNNSTSHKGHI